MQTQTRRKIYSPFGKHAERAKKVNKLNIVSTHGHKYSAKIEREITRETTYSIAVFVANSGFKEMSTVFDSYHPSKWSTDIGLKKLVTSLM